jgi:hypothetical protein
MLLVDGAVGPGDGGLDVAERGVDSYQILLIMTYRGW